MILPSAVAERDEALQVRACLFDDGGALICTDHGYCTQGLRLWAFSSCLYDDFGLLGVTSDVVHPLSLVFDSADHGRRDPHQLA